MSIVDGFEVRVETLKGVSHWKVCRGNQALGWAFIIDERDGGHVLQFCPCNPKLPELQAVELVLEGQNAQTESISHSYWELLFDELAKQLKGDKRDISHHVQRGQLFRLSYGIVVCVRDAPRSGEIGVVCQVVGGNNKMYPSGAWDIFVYFSQLKEAERIQLS